MMPVIGILRTKYSVLDFVKGTVEVPRITAV